MDCSISSFSKKVLSGVVPSHEDWNSHLLEVHKKAPAMTPPAFSTNRTCHGQNSYQVLADTLLKFPRSDIRVLDLACGDGHLAYSCLEKLGPRGSYLGIDMVDSEIKKAQSLFSDPRLNFLCAQAHQLPIENGSIDVVLCHLAFMLMLPVEAVVKELSRVLVSGGVFSAVTSGAKPQSIVSKIGQVIFSFIEARHPQFAGVKFGDDRTNSPEGLGSLFNETTGFSDMVEIKDFDIIVQCQTNEGLWTFYKDTYFIGMLPREERLEIKAQLNELYQANQEADGSLSFSYPLRKIQVRKQL